MYIIGEVVRVSSDLWLSLWTSGNDGEGNLYYPKDPPPFGASVEDFFLWIYIILGIGYCILTLVRNSTDPVMRPPRTAWRRTKPSLWGGGVVKVPCAPVGIAQS